MMQPNDKVVSRVQTSMANINIPAGCEGTLIELVGGSAIVDWDTPDGVKRMPVLDFQVEPSQKVALAALETKAAESISSDTELDGVRSIPAMIAEFKKLKARVEYLEKINGIDHSAKG